ncbi:MAG: hypothetical protein WCT30_00230 [Desulfurivibrionaceae bacterium]
MIDPISLIKELYIRRRYAFRRRFFPLTACVVLLVVPSVGLTAGMVSALWLLAVLLLISFFLLFSAIWRLPHEQRWLKQAQRLFYDNELEKAERKLMSPPWLVGFVTRIKRQVTLAQVQMWKGDFPGAYSVLQALERETLLPEEQLSVRLAQTRLMFMAGNHMAFRKMMGQLEGDSSQPKERFSYLLLQSSLHALDGEYTQAKAVLEEAIGVADEPKMTAVVYNDLARLEDVQGNDTIALNYYEKAWGVLRDNPLPLLFPIIGHNLLLKFSRNGKAEEALAVLNAYRGMVRSGNVEQVIQLLNDQTHLARQLGDRTLLLNAYEGSERDLLHLLDERQRFAQAVSELRMRLNDDIGFVEHLRKTARGLDTLGEMTLVERFNFLSELIAVIHQYWQRTGVLEFQTVEQRAVNAFLALEPKIEAQLRDSQPVLPLVRDWWYRCLSDVIKFRLNKAAPAQQPDVAGRLFQLLEERRRLFADKGNMEAELDMLFTICDEYVAYVNQLGGQIVTTHGAAAKRALRDACTLLERHWPYPGLQQFALGLAYFCWKIAGDQDCARQWLEQFEAWKLDLTHYAWWIRKWHSELHVWLKHDQRITANHNTVAPLSGWPNPWEWGHSLKYQFSYSGPEITTKT